MTKFQVNDIVRANRRRPNYSYLDTGIDAKVIAVNDIGRYEQYTVEYVYNYIGERRTRQSVVSGGYLTLKTKGIPPVKPKTYAEMTKEDLAKRVVEVSSRLAKEHDWCGVVQVGLVEIGLGDFLAQTTRKLQVLVTTEVEGELGWTDEDFIEQAKYQVNDYVEQYTIDSVNFL